MRPVFSDKETDAIFKEKGYMRFDLLSEEDIRKVMQVYVSKKIKDENTYSAKEKVESLTVDDFIELREALTPIVSQRLRTICPELEAFFVEFLTKSPGKSNIPGHQDWLFTSSESNETPSLSLFIALTEINFENGALGFISGSHLMTELIPPPSPSPYAPLPLLEHSEIIFDYLDYIALQPGQAILFYNNTIHGSYNNSSGKDRIALRLSLKFEKNPLYHYYLNPQSVSGQEEMIQYQAEPDFYVKFRNETIVRYFKENKELPLKELNRFPYNYPKYDQDTLISRFESLGNVRKRKEFINEDKHQVSYSLLGRIYRWLKAI